MSALALGVPWLVVGCAHPVFSLVTGVVLLLGVWVVRAFTLGRRSPAHGSN